MDTINELINVLQGVIIAGLTLRMIALCIRLQHDAEEAEVYKKRIKHNIVILIIVVCIVAIKTCIQSYYGALYAQPIL